MSIGSPVYILSLLLLVGFTAGVYFLFRNKDTKTQNFLLWTMALINVAQHFLKPLIYPQHIKEGFTIVSTAYNVCATLIIFMPLALAFKSRFLKNFFFFVGTVAGIGAIAYPVWFLGKPASELGWEYVRFYICHAFLFMSAVLPLLWRQHRPAFREFWQIGLGFLGTLCLILFNNIAFTLIGFNLGYGPHNLYEGLLQHNACALMGPSATMPSWLGTLARSVTLPVLAGDNATGLYAPILWYAVPMYVGITIAALVIFSVLCKYGLTEPDKLKEKAEKAEKAAMED